jgi:hypothetical protein
MTISLLPGSNPLWKAAPFQLNFLTSIVLRIDPLYRPSRNMISNSTSIVVSGLVAAEMCLPRRCLETALAYLLISLLLHSNGFTRYNILPTSWLLGSSVSQKEQIEARCWALGLVQSAIQRGNPSLRTYQALSYSSKSVHSMKEDHSSPYSQNSQSRTADKGLLPSSLRNWRRSKRSSTSRNYQFLSINTV